MTPHHQEHSTAPSTASSSDPALGVVLARDAQSSVNRTPVPTDPSEDLDHLGQAAIEGRQPDLPVSNRRAIGIMFGIDPSNLYEAPANDESRDRAVDDLD